MNMLAGMLQNQQQGMPQGQLGMNMNLGQMGHNMQQMNFMNQNGGFPPQIMGQNIPQNRRSSDVSVMSMNSLNANGAPNPAQTLLNMLDIKGTDTAQFMNAQGPSPQDQDQQLPSNIMQNINFNDANQQQQAQLIMAMQHRNSMPPPQQQNPMAMPQQNQMPQQQNQQSQRGQNMSQSQQQSSMQSMQASLAQMQANLAQLQGPITPQLLEERQNQIQEFLTRHGHNLSDDQRLNLRQQIGGATFDALFAKFVNPALLRQNRAGGSGNPQNNTNDTTNMPPPQNVNAANNAPANNNMGAPQGTPQSMGGENNMGMMQQMQQMLAQGNNAQGDANSTMSDLMSRQRDKLRNLQVMLKTDDDPNDIGDGQGGAPAAGQNMNPNLMQEFMNSMRMQSQRQNTMQGGQQQGMGPDFFRGNTNLGQIQAQLQQSNAQLQQLQQLQQQAQQQGQQSQRISSAAVEQMMRQHQNGQINDPQQKLQRKRSQEAQLPSQNKMPRLPNQSQSSPLVSMSQDQASMPAANNTRVVPVALSPRYSKGVEQGDISEAALIYTKHALNSIVTSLNSTSDGRVYTIRDLSTCLGAWDLSHSTSSGAKRQKSDEVSSNANDGNADTAFNFYYERSCPILLDAKRSTGAIPFSVEDFGEEPSSDNNGLPSLTGAVVLTFGADEKFTGGIGEEGVLTKAIFEFFFEPRVALGKELDGKDVPADLLVEAEEQIFARMDNEQSSFIKAALHALSPSFGKEGDIKVEDELIYVPTIWSGNTNRVYQYCLLGNFDDEGKELASKRLCVAIQKKVPSACGDGPAKGVCRITVTLSPSSVLAEKKKAANAPDGQNLNEFSSTIHRKIRQNLRCMRPPKLVSPSSLADKMDGPGKRRVNLRRPSMTHLIDPSKVVSGMRCKHELLLDADEVGKVYINGSLIVDCSVPHSSSNGKTSAKANILSTLGTLSPDVLPAYTLFGIDFTFPSCNEAMFFRDIPNKTILEQEYGSLLVDALIDATQFDLDVSGKLLYRLATGRIEMNDEDNDQEDDDKVKKVHSRSSSKSSNFNDDFDDDINAIPSSKISFDDVSKHCIESRVLSSSATDPVGIGAKALSTKFKMHYGKHHFPCEDGTDEEHRLQKILGPLKVPQLVPRRLRDILSRGGYLPLNKMAEFIWKGSGESWDGDHDDSMQASEAMESAIQLLRQAHCIDVKPNTIRFVGRKQLQSADDSVAFVRCWYDASTCTYFVNDSILFVDEVSGPVDGEISRSQFENDVRLTDQTRDSSCAEEMPSKNPTGVERNISGNVDENATIDDESYKASDKPDMIKSENQTTLDAVPAEEDGGVISKDDAKSNAQNIEASHEKTNIKDESSATNETMETFDVPKGDAVSLSKEVASDNLATPDEENTAEEETSKDSQKTDDDQDNKHTSTTPKPSYKPTVEAAQLLALNVAKEHPNPMLLENVLHVILHSKE